MGDDALKAAQSTCAPEVTEVYYTLHKAASELGMSVTELEHVIAAHRLPFVHQFGRKLIAPADLAAYRTHHNIQHYLDNSNGPNSPSSPKG